MSHSLLPVNDAFLVEMLQRQHQLSRIESGTILIKTS